MPEEINIKKSKIILVDNLLQTEHNLKKLPYLFTVNAIGSYKNRFEIRINTKKKHLNNPSNKKLRVHLKKDLLIIKSKEALRKIKIYSLFGKLLYTKKLNGKEYHLNIEKLSKKRILILKVQLKNGQTIKRKIMNQ
mgnify:FL=1